MKSLCGFFNKHGRVKMINLRKVPSFGFLIIRILGRTLSKVEDDLSKKEKVEVEFPNYDFINKRFN